MRYLLTCLLAGCTISPEHCRSWGVNVNDGEQPSGRIVEEHILSNTRGHCYGNPLGCSVAVAEDQYVIYRIYDTGVALHEACHSLYQVADHL